MKTVEVRVTVKAGEKTFANYKSDKAGFVQAPFAHAIRPESMQDVSTLQKEHGNEAEQANVWEFLGNAVQNYIEYAKGTRTSIRNIILSAVEGPSKAIEKASKDVLALGLFPTIETAREFVRGQMKAKGLKVD